MFRLLSDLHLEFSQGQMTLTELPTDKDSVLVLAGDIGIGKRPTSYIEFLKDVAPRFKKVVYIMGNHEFYRGSVVTTLSKVWNQVLNDELDNVEVVENETVIVDNVAYVCSTLWADFDKGNPLTMNEAQMGMNDYKFIRTGPSVADAYQRKLNPSDTYTLNSKARNYIFSEIVKQKEAGNKVVVVTHHGPSWQSVSECYRGAYAYAKLNGAYVSDLDNDILDTEPDVWVHGHTHHSFDYTIGNTRVLCNPRGYYKDELNPEFNPELVIGV